jgi:sterol 14alpha-demethylase
MCRAILKAGQRVHDVTFGFKVTFLVGPKVSNFFHGTESEISVADVYKITVPIFGKGVRL